MPIIEDKGPDKAVLSLFFSSFKGLVGRVLILEFLKSCEIGELERMEFLTSHITLLSMTEMVKMVLDWHFHCHVVIRGFHFHLLLEVVCRSILLIDNSGWLFKNPYSLQIQMVLSLLKFSRKP
ncbi:MAG: hypothetical protein GX428_06940 [Candidatus Atribacteria bacterium]|nr:hypothetical protein [Candidatus Atribacteria bacterium]